MASDSTIAGNISSRNKIKKNAVPRSLRYSMSSLLASIQISSEVKLPKAACQPFFRDDLKAGGIHPDPGKEEHDKNADQAHRRHPRNYLRIQRENTRMRVIAGRRRGRSLRRHGYPFPKLIRRGPAAERTAAEEEEEGAVRTAGRAP